MSTTQFPESFRFSFALSPFQKATTVRIAAKKEFSHFLTPVSHLEEASGPLTLVWESTSGRTAAWRIGRKRLLSIDSMAA